MYFNSELVLYLGCVFCQIGYSLYSGYSRVLPHMFSMCDAWTNSISATWGLARNSNFASTLELLNQNL